METPQQGGPNCQATNRQGPLAHHRNDMSVEEQLSALMEKFTGLQAQNEDIHKEYQDIAGLLEKSETENKRLKKAIDDFGNNPAGFAWAVLERIEQQETQLAFTRDAVRTVKQEMSIILKNLAKALKE